MGNFTGLLLTLLIVLLPTTSFGADRYVRAGATGNGDGSDWTNAYPDFPTIMSPVVNLVRGDTYYIADGTYGPAKVTAAESGTTRITFKKAITSDHGTETGWSATYGDGVATFVGSSASRALQITNDYITFDGQVGGGPSSWKTGHGFKVIDARPTAPSIVLISSAQHIIVSNFEAEGNGGDGDGSGNDGINISGGSGPSTFSADVLITECYIHDTGRAFMLMRSDDTIVEKCWFARNESVPAEHGEGLRVLRAPDEVDNVTIRYNVLEDAEGTGIIVLDGTNHKVYGNVLFSSPAYAGGGHGNGAIGTTTADTVTGTEIYNNTFYNLPGKCGIFFISSPSTGNVAYNNLWYNCAGVQMENVAHDYNALYDSTAMGSSGFPEANGQVTSGNPFVDAANNDWHLTPATSAGIALASPFDSDPDGVIRGADNSWDRGAYEKITNTPSPPSNLRLTVGIP